MDTNGKLLCLLALVLFLCFGLATDNARLERRLRILIWSVWGDEHWERVEQEFDNRDQSKERFDS